MTATGDKNRVIRLGIESGVSRCRAKVWVNPELWIILGIEPGVSRCRAKVWANPEL